MLRDKQKCLSLKNDLLKIRGMIGAKTITMVGQTPAVFLRHKILFEKGMVLRTFGTIFSILETICEIQKIEKIENPKITILRMGKIDSKLAQILKEYEVSGIDLHNKCKAKKLLKNSNIIINLLPKGKMLSEYISFIPKTAIILDNTHPMMKSIKRYKIYKVSVGIKDTKFFLHIPDRANNTISGCICFSNS